RVVERFPWPPRSRRAYLACFGSLLAVVALFPVVAFYQMTFQDEVERFVKRAQLQLARDLAERIEEARADSRQQPTVEAAEVFLRVRLATDWDRYDGAALETETRLAATPTEPLPRVDALDQLLLGVRPHYNEIDEANAGLIFPAAADGSWRSSVEAGRLTLTLASGAGLNGQQPLEITSLLPELRWPGRAGDGLLWPAGLLLVLATPFCLTRLIARRVFLLHVRRPAVATAESAPASALGSLVHLRVGRPAPEPASGLATKDPFVAEEATHFRFIDLKSAADRAFLARPRRHGLERDAVLVFANLETTWDEPDCAAKKETWLRGLSRDHAKTLMALAADPAAPASSPRDATARHAVAREAAVQHERHWADCSPLEQLTLLQVARTGHANSERPELRTLLARGLLRRDPELRLQNESFRRFVLARGRPEGPLPEEARESATSWHNLKGALWVMLTGLAVFLFLTQREAWNVVIGLASAFMVGVNSLSQLSKLLPKAKEPKA
ncbi:MAG TPA: hypothetical protein VNO52_06725, partial [Methylomirabilota bacterium]|nr:hypothetical protein [Methylomirabilota bacterium]